MASVICALHGGELFSNVSGWASFIALVVCLVVALAFQIFQPSYASVVAELERTKLKSVRRGEAVERALSMLLQRLGEHCAVDTSNDRISVYYHTDEHFVMIARHSRNPEYDKPGRRKYELRQGVIGKGWEETYGTALVQLPAKLDNWIRSMTENHGFTRDQALKMRMKSREIGAIRVEGSRNSVGMLVIESTDKDRVNQVTLEAAQESVIFDTICQFVDGYAPVTPRADQVMVEQMSDDETTWKDAKHPSE